MATINTNPSSNPIAIKIVASTLIDNVILNPLESYNSVVQKISSSVPNISLYTTIYPTTNDYVKYIKLTSEFFLKIYLPRFNENQTIYLVPGVYNNLYEDGIQDYTSSTQLSQIPTTINWRQALQKWITTINYAPTSTQPAIGTIIHKDIKISIEGVDTARMDKITFVTIRLQAQVA